MSSERSAVNSVPPFTKNGINRLPLLLEIGTEEIPASFLPEALKRLKSLAVKIFDEWAIDIGGIKTYATPRRLCLIIDRVSLRQRDRVREAIGPSKKLAFDPDGRPTKAAIGFAKAQGVDVGSLRIKLTDRGEYLVAVIEEKGQEAETVLPDMLKEIILSLSFPKSMRWANGNLRFARPIRWILCIFGNEPVTFEIDGIKSSASTRGHRFLSPGAFQIKDISSYIHLLASNYVIVNPEERKRIILNDTRRLAHEVNGMPVEDEELLTTVTFLVEYPKAVLGGFDSSYLHLPKELLITAMKGHQKYFSIVDDNSRLLPYFITISNTREDNRETVRIGAERVLKARLEDARFYFDEDRKIPLSRRIDDLKRVTYQEKLGTLYDKVERTNRVATYIASLIAPGLTGKVERACWLSKTDLLTGVVREFPELQGLMGKVYAMNDKEDVDVAHAIYEQYLPRFSGDKNPESDIGSILSIADKIDNIVAFFHIGLIPTGSEDPFALRRQALGIINILLDKGYKISIERLIDKASENLNNARDGLKDDVMAFFSQRLESMFISDGYDYDIVNAALAGGDAFKTLTEIKGIIHALSSFRREPEFSLFVTAAKRINNILPSDLPLRELKEEFLLEEEEKAIYNRFLDVKRGVEESMKNMDYIESLRLMTGLTDVINRFFDNVLVMDKRDEIKINRLSLLGGLWKLFMGIADFSKIVETLR